MSDDTERPSGTPGRPWGERMMDWAKEKVASEQTAAATAPAGGYAPQSEVSQPLDALAQIDFPRDKREFDEFPLHKLLGLELEAVRPGYALVCLTTSTVTLGGVGGSVHGGLLAAMVDIAMLRALVPLLREGEQTAGTVDLNITFLRPALGKRVFAEATVLRKGRTTVVSEVSITGADGKLFAKGRTIYAIRPSG